MCTMARRTPSQCSLLPLTSPTVYWRSGVAENCWISSDSSMQIRWRGVLDWLVGCWSFSDLAPDTNQLSSLPLLLHGTDERQRLSPLHLSGLWSGLESPVCSPAKTPAGSSIISCILTRIDSSLKRHRLVLLISVTLGTGVYLWPWLPYWTWGKEKCNTKLRLKIPPIPPASLLLGSFIKGWTEVQSIRERQAIFPVV